MKPHPASRRPGYPLGAILPVRHAQPMPGTFTNCRFRTCLVWEIAATISLLVGAGCGTTRSTDTSRTATEQLLVSDAIDRSVQQLNFRPLAGHKVYLDENFLEEAVDKEYLVSTFRQHLLASGCILTESRDEATYVLEARAGSIGTNRSDVLVGVPAINLPMTIPGVPTAIPEIPVVKRTNQRGIAKIGIFAYHRETGTAVWQSGLVREASSGKDTWVLGAGPFQRGTIHEGTAFAGSKLKNPLNLNDDGQHELAPGVAVDEEALFERRSIGIHRLPAPENSPAERMAQSGAEGE